VIGLDTNVLVRYFAQDQASQSRKATDIIERGLSPQEPGFVSILAIAETVWVLERAYRMKAMALAAVVERMLQADTLVIERQQEVFTAMIALKENRGDFADALIGALGLRAGCSRTLTFDRQALRLQGFALL
jgi:predicted nucleic-acid-binding protein